MCPYVFHYPEDRDIPPPWGWLVTKVQISCIYAEPKFSLDLDNAALSTKACTLEGPAWLGFEDPGIGRWLTEDNDMQEHGLSAALPWAGLPPGMDPRSSHGMACGT